MKFEKLDRIDWRKTEKTDDINYLRSVAKTVGVSIYTGKKLKSDLEALRTECLAERRIGRKPIEHKAITAQHEKACAKLPTKTAQIKYLFEKEYHTSVIASRTNMHITNVYACLRNAGIINTGKSIKKSVIAKIKATKKLQKAEAEKAEAKKVTAKK